MIRERETLIKKTNVSSQQLIIDSACLNINDNWKRFKDKRLKYGQIFVSKQFFPWKKKSFIDYLRLV
jgi:hypothetical protein